MKKICGNVKKHAEKIFNCKTKELVSLTHEEHDSYENQKVFHICKKEFIFDIDSCGENMHTKYCKVKDQCYCTGKYRGAAHNICNLRYKTPKIIPIVFYNGLTYDYHFIIKELAKEFEGKFECLGENTEKYITFSVPIKTATYKLKFIDSFRFVSTLLSILSKNIYEGFHNDKYMDCKSYLDYMAIKDDRSTFRCFECKQIILKTLIKD